jgi:hypothetical protein
VVGAQGEPLLGEGRVGPNVASLRVATDPPQEWINPYRDHPLTSRGDDNVALPELYEAQHRAIVDDVPVPYSAEEGRTDVEWLIAVGESARQGSVGIDLPLQGQTALERQMHEEFRQAYGGDPFADAERLLARMFPQRGLMRIDQMPLAVDTPLPNAATTAWASYANRRCRRPCRPTAQVLVVRPGPMPTAEPLAEAAARQAPMKLAAVVVSALPLISRSRIDWKVARSSGRVSAPSIAVVQSRSTMQW